ncbi:cysteine hydrolase family protein [Croceibacterium atlanticum]|uniref:cysteine hydrolase family protein n=1 Tax=Croceibacterium atlanticum TaxID=1267766 RepID=UPI00062C5A4B|nr:cysteine hydrolase [Croceibacterium atlanticum]
MHKIDLPGWAVERGRYLNDFHAIDPAHTALVVVDMQSAFLSPGEAFGNPHAMDIIPAVNQLAGAMRDAGGQVIWTRQTVSDDPPLAMAPWQYDMSDPHVRDAVAALRAGARAHDLHPAMEVGPDDIVIDKYRYSAFACPAGGLHDTLRERGVEMLVIAGTLTNVCCESTARDAYMRGYKVIVAGDACAAVSDEEHNAALLNLRINFADVKDTFGILQMLGKEG